MNTTCTESVTIYTKESQDNGIPTWSGLSPVQDLHLG